MEIKKDYLRASAVNEDIRVLATAEDATAIGWNGDAINKGFVFGHHLMMNWWCGLSFFAIAERPQTNGFICTSRDDERRVGGELHCGDISSVPDQIVALQESRLLLTTTGCETVFSERRNDATWIERCSDRIGLWGLLLFLRNNNCSDRNLIQNWKYICL